MLVSGNLHLGSYFLPVCQNFAKGPGPQHIPVSDTVQLQSDFSKEAMKSEFKPVKVWARSRDVSLDIHYSICSDSHSPNLPAASCRHMLVPARACAHELVT